MCARASCAPTRFDLGLDPAFRHHGRCGAEPKPWPAPSTARWATTTISSRARSYAALFDEVPARSTMPLAPSVASMLQAPDGQGSGAARRPRCARFQAVARARHLDARAAASCCCWPTRACCPRSSRRGRARPPNGRFARGRSRRSGGAQGVFWPTRPRRATRACAGSCGRRLRLPPCVRRRRREGRGQSVSKLCTRAWLKNVALALAHPLASELMALARG